MTVALDRLALKRLKVWKPGPLASWSEPVFISVTDFRIARWRDVPGAWLEGIRLRRTWPSRPGAVGLWLWALPWARRSGSVSVWGSEEDLRRFISSARHVQTMRRFRDAGQLTSVSWTVARFEPRQVWTEAVRRLAGQGPDDAPRPSGLRTPTAAPGGPGRR